jgi:hypothetical protein
MPSIMAIMASQDQSRIANREPPAGDIRWSIRPVRQQVYTVVDF